jgi:hypothetical protein
MPSPVLQIICRDCLLVRCICKDPHGHINQYRFEHCIRSSVLSTTIQSNCSTFKCRNEGRQRIHITSEAVGLLDDDDDDDDDTRSGYARRPYEPSLNPAYQCNECRLALRTREISQHFSLPLCSKNKIVCQSDRESGWKL